MMMVMCRLNVPSIFIYGGSILPGTFRGKPVTIQDVFEAVGQHSVRKLSDADLETLEQHACPSAGACGAQFTANTMATVSEAIGLALPYSAGRVLHDRRREDRRADQGRHSSARHRDPQSAGKRRDGGVGDRRLD
jgi:dihydroxyacid dehydratase/phosphogluconate dehydratase